MRKVLLPLGILMISTLALTAGREMMAVGRGVMHGHPGHMRLAFDFAVYKAETKTTGSVLIWGEGGHPYPDVVLRADHIANAKFLDSAARFFALGRYHDIPVLMVVTVSDNTPFQRPDTLTLLVLDLLGRPIIFTSGEVEQGNIFVGPRD